MAIELSSFNDLHSFKVFFFAGVVGQSRITPGHLDIAVAQELLQALKAHASI
jgi:hypothetical protein